MSRKSLIAMLRDWLATDQASDATPSELISAICKAHDVTPDDQLRLHLRMYLLSAREHQPKAQPRADGHASRPVPNDLAAMLDVMERIIGDAEAAQ